MVILVIGGLADSLTKFRGHLLKEMVSRGHRVLACAPNAPIEVRNELAEMGVEYAHVTIDRVGMNPYGDISTIRELIKLFRKYKPDLFLGYSIKPVIYGSIAAHHSGVSTIYTMIEGLGYAFMSSGIGSRMVGQIATRFYKVALRHSEKIFFLNPDDLNVFQGKRLIRAGQAIMIDGIGVDLNKFIPAQFPDEATFLMIGRLLYDKGVREYAGAARLIKERYPRARFLLVGWLDTGNPVSISERELQTWINSGAIEYLGKLSDVRPVLASSSVYVLPSYHEGMPVTVMEAMAMGRAVITTDAPGCRETVRHGENGFLVPVKDVLSLAEAIESFIKEPRQIKSMGAASRRIAEERFDVHQINKVMLEAMGIT